MGHKRYKYRSIGGLTLGVGMLLGSLAYIMGSIVVNEYRNPLVAEHSRLEYRLRNPIRTKCLLNPLPRDSILAQAAYFSRERARLEQSSEYLDERERFDAASKRDAILFISVSLVGTGLALYSAQLDQEESSRHSDKNSEGKNDTL